MIPALTVALFAFTTALYLLDTARHKKDLNYKLRWAGASIPFFVLSASFAWQGIYIPMPAAEFETYQCIYWSILVVVLYPTGIWFADVRARWRLRHGR